jgi:hypothetical protein
MLPAFLGGSMEQLLPCQPCPRCVELQAAIDDGRRRLGQLGRELPGPRAEHEFAQERALARWLSDDGRRRGRAASYRAGWQAAVQHLRPQVREWQNLWQRATMETTRLQAELGVLKRRGASS